MDKAKRYPATFCAEVMILMLLIYSIVVAHA